MKRMSNAQFISALFWCAVFLMCINDRVKDTLIKKSVYQNTTKLDDFLPQTK